MEAMRKMVNERFQEGSRDYHHTVQWIQNHYQYPFWLAKLAMNECLKLNPKDFEPLLGVYNLCFVVSFVVY
jgi:hypothetical protein